MASAGTWIASEPGFPALRQDLVRLFRRAGRRRWTVLGVALLMTLVVVALAFRARRPYRARIAVRMTEMVDMNQPRSTWTERELRSYVNSVALTSQVLMAAHQRFLADPRKPLPPGRALERLREDVEVRVLESATVAQAQGRKGARSAHVVIAFGAPTAEQAQGVVRALAQPVVATSARRRRQEAALAREQAALAARAARETVTALTKDAERQMGTMAPMPRTVSPMTVTGLERAIRRERERLALLDAEAQAADRRERVETRLPGMDFEIAGEVLEEPVPLGALLGGVGCFGFLLLLPVAALLVGAFDRHIEVVEDLTRLGIPALGRLRET